MHRRCAASASSTRTCSETPNHPLQPTGAAVTPSRGMKSFPRPRRLSGLFGGTDFPYSKNAMTDALGGDTRRIDWWRKSWMGSAFHYRGTRDTGGFRFEPFERTSLRFPPPSNLSPCSVGPSVVREGHSRWIRRYE